MGGRAKPFSSDWCAQRNPMPPRSMSTAEKSTRPLSEEQFGLLMAAITRAAHLDRNAQRDYALIKGAYLLGLQGL